MWENAYLSTENPRALNGPWTQLHTAGFAHMTLLCYISNVLALEGILKKIRIFCCGNIDILSCTNIHYQLNILKKRHQEKQENVYLTLKNARASRAKAGP